MSVEVTSRTYGLKASTCRLYDGAAMTLTADYNDLEGVRALFEANKGEIAGVILEPVVGNSGFIPPTQEFLEVCRRSAPYERLHLSVTGGLSPLHPGGFFSHAAWQHDLDLYSARLVPCMAAGPAGL